ncbi:MAG: hypothetical protein WC822_06435 [Candidatus Paceibacterota bacterium]|jgi:hypothetical protein
MKNLVKKIIVLTYLIIFLFSFLISFNKSFAQTPKYTVKIETNSSTVEPGKSIPVMVSFTYNSGSSLHFLSGEIRLNINNGGLKSEYFISSEKCSIPIVEKGKTFQCPTITFNSSVEKIHTISGELYNIGGVKLDSDNTNVAIKVEKTTLNCTSPQVPNETKTACIVPAINTDTTYTMLAPLPGLEGTIDTVDACPFGKYLNIIIKLIMGISAVLAMIMITMGGIQYITSDLVSNKEAGRETISHAILGLIMMLGAFLILNTVNPKLLNACLKIPTVTINVSPEQEQIIKNREGLGKCEVITDVNSPCHPSKLAAFSGTSSATEPFNTRAAQASAICQLESHGDPSSPVGNSPSAILDKCSDNKPFSFGLFQINAAAHRNNIPACKDAFEIPIGAGSSQGDCLEKDKNSGYCAKWSCKTIEPAYTACQNYLINPVNNIQFAATSTSLNRWTSWTTYNSCRGKF